MLQISEYEPQRRLELNWTGSPPARVIARIPVTLFLAPFYLMPVVGMALIVLVVAEGRQGAEWWHLLFALPVALVAAAVFWGGASLFALLLGALCGYTKRFAADLDRDRIEVTDSGWMVLFNKQRRIPVSRLKRVKATIPGKIGKLQRLTLSLAWEDESGRKKDLNHLQLEVEGMDTQAEALRLLCSIGDASGWRWYQVEARTHLKTEIKLLRGEAEADEAKPLPAYGIAEGAGGEPSAAGAPSAETGEDSEIEAPPVEVPPIKVPKFSPETFQFDGHKFREIDVEWDPPRRVRLFRGRAPRSVLVFSGIMLAIPGAVIGGIVAAGQWREQPLRVAAGAVAGGLLTGGAGALYFRRRYRQREFIVDWSNRLVRFHEENDRETFDFHDLRGLRFRGRTRRKTRANQSHWVYYAEVFADTRRGKRLITRTNESSSRDRAYKWGASLSRDLARHLDLPWEWSGFEG